MNDRLSTKLSQSIPTVSIFLIGILLLILSGSLTYFSALFDYNHAVFDMPVIKLVGGLVLAGIIYLPLLPIIHQQGADSPIHRPLIFILAISIGVAMRLVLIPSEPALEDDYQRYLWDGAVTAHGFNPYRFSPEAIKSNQEIPVELSKLSTSSGAVIDRINHPDLRTIYPLVTQAFFALSYWIKPWSITTWKLILLIMDLITLCLLLILLKEVELPPIWSLLYWWNPVVLKELFSSGHMEGILTPFVLAAVLLAVRRFYWQSSMILAIAAGVKIWPALLLPVLFRRLWRTPKKLVKQCSVFTALLIALFIPVFLAEMNASSGFLAYAQHWKTNSALTPAIEYFFQQLVMITEIDLFTSNLLARFTIAGLILTTVLFICWEKIEHTEDILRRVSIIVTTIFFLSPAQFPWYLIWVLPFMTIFPVYGVLILTATIPLYYTAFYLYPRELNYIFSNAIVWIIWIPAWIQLTVQVYSNGLRGYAPVKSSSGKQL